MAGRRFPYTKKAAAGGLGSINLSTGTFTRSSAAMWWDGTTVTEYATDVLREPETNWLALEGSRESFVTGWSAFDGGDWGSSGLTSVTANDINGPNGSLEADKLIAPGANDYVSNTDLDAAASVAISIAVFMKGNAGTESIHVLMKDLAGSTSFTTAALTTSWDRYTHRDTDNGTGTAQDWRMQSAAAGTWWGWGYTAEESYFVSSPVENTSPTASATRSADSLTLTNAPAFLQTGKWQTKVRPSCSDADFVSEGTNMTLIDFQTTGEFLAMIVDAGAVKVRLSDGVTTTTTGAITFSADQELTITCDMASGDITIAGATTGDGTTVGAGAITFPASTNYRIGADYGGTAPFFGLITKTIDEVA